MRAIILILTFCLVTSCNGKIGKGGAKEEPDAKYAYSQELGPVYEFKEYGISLRIPKDWTFGQFDEKSYYLKLDCDSASIFCPSIVIRFVPGKNTSMDEYVRLFELASRDNFNSFESKGVSVEKFDGLEVGVVDFELTEQETRLRGTTALVGLDNYILNVGLMATRNDINYSSKYRTLLMMIVQSIEVL